MESSAINNSGNHPSTFEELLNIMEDPSGRYKHLQIIFYRNKNSLGLGQTYLVVNSEGFALYRLNDVNYDSGILLMTFTNPKNGNTETISLDVENEHPEHFLICWEDLKQLMYEEALNDLNDEELLELESEEDLN